MLMAGKDWRGQALPNALSGFGLVVQGVLLILCGLAVLTSASAQSAPPVPIVALGDSLTAGYGLPANAAFPVVLEKALKARGYSVSIINAGVSGDTSQGGLDRLDWSVPDGIRGVILELGANDALRAKNPADTMRALDGIITRLKARNIEVMLCGMLAPPNLGAEYTRAFEKVFTTSRRSTGWCSIRSSLTELPESRSLISVTAFIRRQRVSASLPGASSPRPKSSSSGWRTDFSACRLDSGA